MVAANELREIVGFAKTLEEQAETFYRYAEIFAQDKKLKALFKKFANEENKHKSYFDELIAKIEQVGGLKSKPVVAQSLITLRHILARNQSTLKKRTDKEFSKIRTESAAIDFASEREMDAIFYYIEMKNIVPLDYHELLDEIIEMERGHMLKLYNVKKTLGVK